MELLLGLLLVVIVIGSTYTVKKAKAEYERKQKEEQKRLMKEKHHRLLLLEQKDEELQKNLKKCKDFFEEIEKVKNRYFTNSQEQAIANKYLNTFEYFSKKKIVGLYPYLKEFNKIYPILKNYRANINKDFVKAQLVKANEFLSDIDGKSLDDQQRQAVIVDEDNNLVIAGAGSGKTLTIAGKVAYLVNYQEIKPEEILLITFTNKAALEMKDRVVEKLKIPVDVKTFHALGNSIITRAVDKKPTIEDDQDKILENYFKNEIKHKVDVMSNLLTFFGNYLNDPKNLEDFDDLGEYLSAQKYVSLETLKSICEKNNRAKVTLQNERVKSIEEVNIANFLFLNGIQYEYEKEYEYETGDRYYRQYRPDFYLNNYGIYIEHFGVNRQMRTPQYSEMEENKYINDMNWKRELHKKNSTVLYETYSYQFREGTILNDLENGLKGLGVKFRKLEEAEISSFIDELKGSKNFKEFQKLMGAFLALFKSNGYSTMDIDKMFGKNELIKASFTKERNRLFLTIFKDIYEFYQEYLTSRKRIDFNDMINISTDIVKNNVVKYNYKYIIVDEYQDISNARFKLIKAIRKQCGSRIMAVGDDWQSIYRFAGSDISLFTSFEKMFGFSEVMKIEKTYRNGQQLIDVAASFVMKNPKQLIKQLRSNKSLRAPVKILGYITSKENALSIALNKLSSGSINQNKNIILLGRNNFDVDFLKESKYFNVSTSKEDVIVKSAAHPQFKIKFLTVHRSKGLEADEVIVLNCENSLLGFPNQIADDSVLDFVLNESDGFMYGEERRLFYVALTRTKNQCILLTPTKEQSIFIKELIKSGIDLEEVETSSDYNLAVKCPKCMSGLLLERENSERHKFLGCSNYPGCNYTFKDANLLHNPIRCNMCNGYMIKRTGGRGDFYGCENYPLCNETKSIDITVDKSKIKSKTLIQNDSVHTEGALYKESFQQDNLKINRSKERLSDSYTNNHINESNSYMNHHTNENDSYFNELSQQKIKDMIKEGLTEEDIFDTLYEDNLLNDSYKNIY